MCKTCNGTGNLNELVSTYGVLIKACPDCLPSAEELKLRDFKLYQQFAEAHKRLGMVTPDWLVEKLKGQESA